MYSRLTLLDKICISLETYAHMENLLRLRFLESRFSNFFVDIANIYRRVQGIYRDLCVQVFITGKTFDISKNPF